MKSYLQECDIINFSHPLIQKKAKALAEGLADEIAIVKACFNFVRDDIAHSGDTPANTTIKASDVLEMQTGWCYAKSHLLAALLRANNIPCALMYQRLNCNEYHKGMFCLHGLNSVYLKEHGWYRVDARGNKEGVNAQFTPPIEQLAFELSEEEFDIETRYAKPLETLIEHLLENSTYDKMVENLPDI